jgi:hypothetical protein
MYSVQLRSLAPFNVCVHRELDLAGALMGVLQKRPRALQSLRRARYCRWPVVAGCNGLGARLEQRRWCCACPWPQHTVKQLTCALRTERDWCRPGHRQIIHPLLHPLCLLLRLNGLVRSDEPLVMVFCLSLLADMQSKLCARLG